jgi:hypothetical protein
MTNNLKFKKDNLEFKTNENEEIISIDSITVTKPGRNVFPIEFKCKFESFGHKFEYKFQLSDDDDASGQNDIYINDPVDGSRFIKYNHTTHSVIL